jgi:NAD(P)-dependent dehydrogenase (short-subunit alcohol dehydrogenase family)
MDRFNNKRILITGGTRGMGFAGAKRVVAEGGRVIVTGPAETRISSDSVRRCALRAPAARTRAGAGDHRARSGCATKLR